VEPFKCSTLKCTITTIAIIKGNVKCKLKNLFNVGLPTEKPPQIHWAMDSPIIGTAVNKFVITVAPQKLI
jgi:hypothetical protein